MPERIFLRSYFEKKLADDNKSMKNFPKVSTLSIQVLLILLGLIQTDTVTERDFGQH